MDTVEERVDTLERMVADFVAYAKDAIPRLDRTCERLDRTCERLDRDFEALRSEQREHVLEMARIADRIGRFTEDIVGPNIPRLAHEVFGINQFQFFAERVEKVHHQDPARMREFDFVVAGEGQLVITESKSTARVKYIEEFATGLAEVFDYFPEYKSYRIVPIFASMALGQDFVRRLTRLKIYALALGQRTMELLNLEEVRGPRQ